MLVVGHRQFELPGQHRQQVVLGNRAHAHQHRPQPAAEFALEFQRAAHVVGRDQPGLDQQAAEQPVRGASRVSAGVSIVAVAVSSFLSIISSGLTDRSVGVADFWKRLTKKSRRPRQDDDTVYL